jgi:DNA-binding NarL/FixJ family response regulator
MSGSTGRGQSICVLLFVLLNISEFSCRFYNSPSILSSSYRESALAAKEMSAMEAKKQILIVEDHQLFREGLKAMLSSSPEYEIAGEARDGLEAIQMIRKCNPDIVLLDLSMPKMDGFSVLKEIKAAMPEVKILVLSVHESDQCVLQAFEAQADGYAIKDSSREEFRIAIHRVLEGKRYISPGIAGSVLEGYLEGRKTLKSKTSLDTVTQREKEILKLLGEGYQNKEIAEMLNISVKTVEKHRANIMNKLDLHNAAALTMFAFEHGLIDPKR